MVVVEDVARDLLAGLVDRLPLRAPGASLLELTEPRLDERTIDTEGLVEDLYRRIQLPEEWVARLEQELEDEIVDRQTVAAELRVPLTKNLATLADERQKLLRAYYSNAIPLSLLKSDQERITDAEEKAKVALAATEADLKGWQEVLKLAIRLAGNCHAAYLKAPPKVRRRFNEALIKAIYIKERKIARVEYTEVFEVLFLRQSLNRAMKVEVRVPEFTR